MRNILPCTALMLALCFSAVLAQQPVVVRPVQTDEILLNPGMGFNTSQHLENDAGPDSIYDYTERLLDQEQYPKTTIAYLRFYWYHFEPEPGVYNWYIIDNALKMARERGQALALRLVPYGNHPRHDIPGWLREQIGESRDLGHSSWRVDPEDPRYVENWNKLVRAAGERYDGHPDLEFVDISIVGFWGEGAGSELLTEKTRRSLVDAYLEAFRKTRLVMLLTDERTNGYGRSKRDVGWRVDCLGDLGFWADDQGGWTHMWDCYPQRIIETGMQDSWKTAPVVLELCGVFNTWKNREGYGIEEVKYIIQQSLKWHISVLNAKSSPVPEQWRPLIDEWLKKMGYRLALRKFTYPAAVRPGEKLTFTSWWENKGVAPCYSKFSLALRLTNPRHSEILPTGADITGWLPGDNLYDDAVFLPREMPEGEYDLELGLLDPRSLEPVVRLAVEGRSADGWYRLGRIRVEE
jgi:uncharacterized protein DUF4832/glycosyl hydrolase family 42 (putative beta-galactosidase)